jgi:predicted nuclease of predicted toxin-antitoxin system
VRFLVDAQLPPALARWLVGQGHEARHVADLAMSAASDRAIWGRAVALGATLVTKGRGFRHPTGAWCRERTAVVWVRIGNSTKRVLLERFSTALPAIVDALERGETIVQLSD